MKAILNFWMILITLPGYSNSYFLSVNGNDLNKGNHWFVPFKTFDKAQMVLKPGDTLHIMKGDYYTSKPFQLDLQHQGKEGQWIVYKNYLNHKPQIHSGSKGAISIQSSQYISLEGLHFVIQDEIPGDGADLKSAVIVGGSFASPSTNIKIYNCFFKNFNHSAIELSYFDFVTLGYNKFYKNAWSPQASAVIAASHAVETNDLNVYHFIIQANVFEQNGSSTPNQTALCNPLIHLNYTDAHLIQTSKHGIFYNNILYMNQGPAMVFESVSGVHIVHNTFYKNNLKEFCQQANLELSNSVQCKVYNNIFYTCASKAATRIFKSPSTLFSNNLYYNHSYREPGIHELVGNPEFELINEITNEFNFKLQSNSPAINQGLDENLVDIDFEGNPRKFDLHTDIGALEFRQRLMPSLKDIKAGPQTKKIKSNWSSLYLQDQKTYTLWNQADSSFLIKMYNPLGKMILDDRTMLEAASSFEFQFNKLPDGIYTVVAFNGTSRYLERIKVFSKRRQP